jgi:hypothetical protein
METMLASSGSSFVGHQSVAEMRLIVVDGLPRPALGAPVNGLPSASNETLTLAVDIALKVENKKSVGNITKNIHRRERLSIERQAQSLPIPRQRC